MSEPRKSSRLRSTLAAIGPLRAVVRGARGVLQGVLSPDYQRLYERHGRRIAADESIGDGDFDLVGRVELGILQMEGLRPDHTVLDFGCGTGRLAVHLIPMLPAGHYIGVDIAASMLKAARHRVVDRLGTPRGPVTWRHQTTDRFSFPDACVDLMCAFSVFTHMEHEDAHRYLIAARRVVRPGGKLVFSCLPMNLEAARDVFLRSACLAPKQRWSQVRNVTTSVELMNAITNLAGWEVKRWYAGDERNISVPGEAEKWALGQSTCVLIRPNS